MFTFTVKLKDLSKIKTLIDNHNPQLLIKGFIMAKETLQGVEKSYITTDLKHEQYLFNYPTKLDPGVHDGRIKVVGILNDMDVLWQMGLNAA